MPAGVEYDTVMRTVEGSLLVSILIEVAVPSFYHGLEIFIDCVDSARCVHPSSVIVEPLIDEKLSPRHRAVGIESFVAHHLQFGAEEKARVRIDQKKRVMIDCIRRCHREAVGSAELFVSFIARRSHSRRVPIEFLEWPQIHPLD